MDTKVANLVERIPVFRAGISVTSLLGTLGTSIKETRLTAWLGYLIAESSENLRIPLRLQGRVKSVILEHHHDDGRSDILVETETGLTVIEAKVDWTDPASQAARYNARQYVLLTQYIPTIRQRQNRRVAYVNWQQLADNLHHAQASMNSRVRFVSRDFLNYLEAHRMIKTKESVEVYAREINEPATLQLFLRGQLYTCRFEKSRLTEALYFAPHFGKRIVATYPGVGYGISYVARIEDVQVVGSSQDVKEVIKKTRGKLWFKQHGDLLKPEMRKWKWENGYRLYFVFVDTPRLVFNPPVVKENLQKGAGWLSRRFLSFDQLFAARAGKICDQD